MALFRVALGPEGKKLLGSQPAPNKPDGTGPIDKTEVATLLHKMDKAVIGKVNDSYGNYFK